MRVSRTLTITFCLIVGMFVLMPSFSVFAADPQFTNPLNIESPDPSNPRQVAAVSVELHARILKLVVQFLSVILFLMMLWGGWQYLTAAGDPEKVESGQRTMVWAVLGAIIIFSSYAITVWVIEKFAAPFGINTTPQADARPSPAQDGGRAQALQSVCCLYNRASMKCGKVVVLPTMSPEEAEDYFPEDACQQHGLAGYTYDRWLLTDQCSAYTSCITNQLTPPDNRSTSSITACCVFPVSVRNPGSGNYCRDVTIAPTDQDKDLVTYCNGKQRTLLWSNTGNSDIGWGTQSYSGPCNMNASPCKTAGSDSGSTTGGNDGAATGATGATGKGCCVPILAGTSKAYASCYEPIPDNNGRLFCNRGGVQDGRACSTVSECNLGTPGDPYEPGCCYWDGTPERCAYVGSDTECRTRRSGDSFRKGERCNDTCALKESNDIRYP